MTLRKTLLKTIKFNEVRNLNKIKKLRAGKNKSN